MNELEGPETSNENPRSQAGLPAALWVAIAVILVLAVVAVGYGYRRQSAVRDLTEQNSEMTSEIEQMHGQLAMMTQKLSQLSEAQMAAAEASQSRSSSIRAASTAAARRRMAAEAKRMQKMQAQINDEQNQLNDAKNQIASSSADLQNNLNSTRDDLNGSIARTHDELVALEQRGERSYFEFDLSTKPRHFQHTGPIQLSLRKADPKHKQFDLAMIVDDNRLTKKHVDLYEPIWIRSDDDMQPVQIVINRITKGHVHGYVSAPKYSANALPPAAPASEKTTIPPSPVPDNKQPASTAAPAAPDF